MKWLSNLDAKFTRTRDIFVRLNIFARDSHGICATFVDACGAVCPVCISENDNHFSNSKGKLFLQSVLL